MENLPVGDLDSTPGATFKWWLWMANLGYHTHTVVGTGMTRAVLVRNDENVKVIVVHRSDNSEVEITLSRWARPDGRKHERVDVRAL